MKQKNILLYGLLAYGTLLFGMNAETIKKMREARKESLIRYISSAAYRKDKKTHLARISSKKIPRYKTEEDMYDNILYKDKFSAQDELFLIEN